VRAALHFGIERQKERVVVRRRTQAVNKLGQKTHNDHPRFETREIDDVMKFHVVHHEQIAAFERDLLIAHPKPCGAIERQEEFQALVPGCSASVPARRVVEQFDQQRKLSMEPDIVMAAPVQLRRDVMRLEMQSCRHG
jgi:hypothetical protein